MVRQFVRRPEWAQHSLWELPLLNSKGNGCHLSAPNQQTQVRRFTSSGWSTVAWAIFSVLIVTRGSYAQLPGTVQQEIERARNSGRLSSWEQQGHVPSNLPNLSDPNPPNPSNFMGVDPGTGVANYLGDTALEAANMLQCLDFRLVDPGCWCCISIFGVPIPVFPAYEYRYPTSRYENTRQPFQSDYWPPMLMRVFQAINPNEPGQVAIFASRMSRLKSALALANPAGAGSLGAGSAGVDDAIREGIRGAINKIPNPSDNKGRGGGKHPVGISASTHAVVSAFRTLPPPFAVKNHAGAIGMLVPSFTEDPLHYMFSRSPVASLFVHPDLAKIGAEQLLDPTGCIRKKQADWQSVFDSSDPFTQGMPPEAFPGFLNGRGPTGSGVQPPCLRYSMSEWFPFTNELNVQSETEGAASASIRQAKLNCHLLQYDDIFDLKEDRFQYIRGNKLRLNGYDCVHPEMPYESFGKGAVLERPAEPITITHWKRFSGCPQPFFHCFSCPDRIDLQPLCNNFVRNRELNEPESPSEWPWE